MAASLPPSSALTPSRVAVSKLRFRVRLRADLTLKRGANQMHAVRSRRKFASLKTEAVETPAEATWAQRTAEKMRRLLSKDVLF